MSSDQFGGIFGKLKGLVFTDEYLQQQAEVAKSAPVPSATTAPSKAPITVSVPTYTEAPEEDMLTKVRSLVEKMNKPEIDFLEVWNAAEAMGSISESTVKNAFVALKIASANKLSKENVLSSGEFYCAELKNALESDIAGKVQQKEKLAESKNQSSNTLSKEVSDLNRQIAELQNQLAQKSEKLRNIDADFNPKLAAIDQKIVQGQSAVTAVIQEMQNVLQIVEKAV